MPKFVKLLLLCLTLLTSTGCGGRLQPVMAPRTEVGTMYSATNIEQAILNALVARHWLVVERVPGSITAEVTSRGKYAKVLIRYNAAGWVIDRLDSSPNLKWRPEPAPAGSIHPHYNRWVQWLDDETRQQLTRIAPQLPPAGAPEATQPAAQPAVPAQPATSGGEVPAAMEPSAPAQPAASDAATPVPAN